MLATIVARQAPPSPRSESPRSTSIVRAALREAALAGVVMLLLGIPLLGFQTVQQPHGLQLETRWSWVAFAVAAVAAGRFLLALWYARRDGRARRERAVSVAPPLPSEAGVVRGVQRFLGPAGILIAVALPFLPFPAAYSRYVLDVGILVLTYVMLGWGLNIVVGLAGLLDLGYVAFYAVGAYSYALLSLYLGWGFWECLPMAGLLAASFGIMLGFPVLRLRGDYLAIVTLGFGEMIRVIIVNWQSLTKGPNGITGIPRPSFFGIPFTAHPAQGQLSVHTLFGLEFSPMHRIYFLYYVILALALLTNAFTLRIRRLPIGRAWEALREDEIACRSLGINPTNTKLTAFAIGAMFGGFAGSFFAARQGFISPESFTFIESAIILAIVVLGGMGSQLGVVIAAVVLIGGPEVVRDLAEYRMLAFGGLMVLIMIWRPRGLLAHRQPTIRLGKRFALPAGAGSPAPASCLTGRAGEGGVPGAS